MSKLIKLLFTCFLLFIAFSIGAEVYKWVDENGKVHYSDKKVGKVVEKVEIKKDSSSNSENSVIAEERLNKQKKYLDYRQSEREEKKHQREVKKREEAENNRYCVALRDELNSMVQEYAIWYDLDEDTGERHYLSDEELEQRIEEFKSKIKKNCR
ncbi:MAG: DUF4124 domain-containing protein [Gammaproteobacteria bacterium]